MHFPLSVTVISLLIAAAPAQAQPRKGPPRATSVDSLTLAAWKPDHRQIEALLDAGEDPNRGGQIGLTPWMMSLIAKDRTGFRMLFDAVRDFKPEDPMTGLIFQFQVVANDRELVEELLKRGVSPNARANDGTTAVMLAAANGHPEMVGLLLARGAQVNLVDRQGDTALMSAVRAGCLDCVSRLITAGAQVDQKDRAGNTASSYAVRSGRQDVQRKLRDAGAHAPDQAVGRPAPASATAAVARSLPLLERAATEWTETRSCNACHMQPVMLQVNGVARSRGFTADKIMLDTLDNSIREDYGPQFEGMARKAIQTEEGVAVASLHVGGDQAFSLAQTLSGALDAGLPLRSFDQSSVLLLARMQQPDGSWRHGPDRVPLQSGDATSTALAARVLKAYAGQIRTENLSGRVARARRWLAASVPRTTDDAAYRLLGLRWLDAEPRVITRAAATLKQRQLASGAWTQVDGLNPDAYATGLALVALHQGSAMPGSDPVYRKGIDYLRATQEPDGSWLVHKRSVPVNRYFESGFPHGKFQFSSFMGTAWATMALMYGEPVNKLASQQDHRSGAKAGPM